ncbi:MAG: hypothetical protein ACP5DZ_01500 [Bacteroidales bacterium]
MKNTHYLVFLFAALLVFFSACEKDDEENDDTLSNEEVMDVIGDYAKAQNMFAEATDEAESATRTSDDSLDNRGANPPKHVKTDSFPQITIDPFDLDTWPKTIRVNYGDQNMTCEDGRQRRGVINIEATDFYREPGSKLTITFENFYQNDHKVEGTRICTNNGQNTAGNITYTLEVVDGHITTPEGGHIYYEENTEREWVAGEETLLNPWDDNYLITGDQSGISSDSVNYTLTIHDFDPLDVIVNCKWIRAGKLDMSIENFPLITIDFGIGTCDNEAVAKINGVDYTFYMQ